MSDRTEQYLQERFREYYESVEVARPPDGGDREWAYVPFEGAGMVRHRSLTEVGSVPAFLRREAPRHVYASVATYDDPAAESMAVKGYRVADLAFDLDADHLPEVDPESDSYARQLAACKQRLLALLDLLETDLGFESYDVAFSGRRGYHVHVREPAVRELDADARREIAEYVRGADLTADSLLDHESVGENYGRATPARARRLDDRGGWPRRLHDRLVGLVDVAERRGPAFVAQRIKLYDGIGEARASALAAALAEKGDRIRAGNADVHGAMATLLGRLVDDMLRGEASPIDEPVTTDTHRLMRVPGTIHGGSALAVVSLPDREAVEQFEPFVDAVPEPFRDGPDVTIEIDEPTPSPLSAGVIEPGVHSVPGHVGMHLLASGAAEKAEE